MARWWVASLLLALLASSAAAADGEIGAKMSGAALRKKRDQGLQQKLDIVERAQKNRTDTSDLKNMTSDIVEEAPEAELWNADGDVSTVGACEQDIDRFCPRVEPGEGRLAECLMHRLIKETLGIMLGRNIGMECRAELAAFVLDRATNINKDVPLARACRDDVRKHCSNKKYDRDSAADVLDCLRRVNKKKLSDKCAQLVLEEEEAEAMDWRVDSGLHAKCAADVATLCSDADAGEEGAVTQCLLDHIGQVSSACVEELERVEEERAEDVRLDRPLFRACSADMWLFCEGEEYGDGKMERCLQDHRYKEEFSERCRQALEERMARQSGDYELNYGLREYCEDDIARLCKTERDMIALREGFAADAQVITCLETMRVKIRDERCRQEVHRQMRHEAEDIRFDHELAAACHTDVKRHCKDVVPGSARIIGCLEDNQSALTKDCAAMLFKHQQKLAEDIDFKFPLHHACVTELSIFCPNVPHGHARVIRCLQDNIDDDEMSEECRGEVEKDQLQSLHDYRLNYRLYTACSPDLAQLCADEMKRCSEHGTRCRGAVTNCLRDRVDDIRSEECRAEVMHVVKAQVANYRADPQLEGACAADVRTFCRDVRHGRGRVHECLRRHWSDISPECKQQESKLQQLEARDVRLRLAVAAACTREMSAFCKGMAPGKGRMFRCLVDNMGRGGFSEKCKQQVLDRAAQSQTDYRLNYAVSAACQADVEAQCAAEQAQVGQGRGAVLRCLVARYKALSEPCQAEVSRGARVALWAYKEGAPLTEVCDRDVQARCPSLPRMDTGFFAVGGVGQCLSKQVAQGGEEALSPGCKQLVLVAAPRDARAVFDSHMSLEAAAAKVAQIAHAAGLSSTFVARGGARGGAIITLTGWMAFAAACALAAVVLGMLGFGLWRYLRSPGPRGQRYSPITVKEGDV